MNPPPDRGSVTESFSRVLLCRLFSFVAILSLWHVPDWWAAIIYGVGIVVFYIPRPAAAKCSVPPSIRATWFAVATIMIVAYLFVPAAAPANSVIPPAFKYGGLALLGVQIAFDFYRRKRLAEPRRHVCPAQH